MRKILVSALVAGIVTFAGICTAGAEGTGAVVKVPVPFIVGGKVMPAGNYQFTSQTNDWSVVMVRSVERPLIAFTATHAVRESETAGGDVRVAFANYHGHYFLKQIAVSGGRAHAVAIDREGAEQALAKLNLLTVERAEPAK